MNIKVYPSKLSGTVDIIKSKSDVHRLLIASALSNEPTKILGRTDAVDITATINCLNALGAKITVSEDGYSVIPLWNSPNKLAFLDAIESGSTLRFLFPVVSALGIEAKIYGKSGLAVRPMGEIISALTKNSAVINSTMPYHIKGKLTAGIFEINASISSQFISGLLFALPLLDGDSRIVLKGKRESVNYIDMTLKVIRAFGISVIEEDDGYTVSGGQKYISPKTIEAEGDWSSASFWLAAGVIGGDIEIKGLSTESCQGDKAFINILKQMGARIEEKDNAIIARKSELKGIEADCSDIPDIVPPLAVVSAFSCGETRLKNIERLRIKESDRILSTMHILENLGIQSSYEGELIIQGGSPTGGTIDSHNDHRIAMSAAVAATFSKEGVTIIDAMAITKSYPDFYEKLVLLGGKISAAE